MSENEKNEQNEYAPLKGIKIVDWTQVQSSPIKSNQVHHVLNF